MAEGVSQEISEEEDPSVLVQRMRNMFPDYSSRGKRRVQLILYPLMDYLKSWIHILLDFSSRLFRAMENASPDDPLSPDGSIRVHPRTHRPSTVWEELFQTGRRISRPHRLPGIQGQPKVDSVRFVCISDTHCKLGQILSRVPPGDVLIHAGDFSYLGDINEVLRFNEELAQLPHPHKIVIAGNHELTFDPGKWHDGDCRMRNMKAQLSKLGVGRPQELLTNCTYLEDSEVTVLGYRIYGAPWQPQFCGWGFNVERGEKILRLWNKIPEGVDILVTHGPPLGHGDLTKTGVRAGCVELLNTVQFRVRPKFHIFGHIHEGYGVSSNSSTVFINCSICTARYQPRNQPVVFDLPLLPGVKKSKSNELDTSA